MEAARSAADPELPVEYPIESPRKLFFWILRTFTLKKEGHDGEVRSAGHSTELVISSARRISVKAHPKGAQDVQRMFTACAKLVDAFWFWSCVTFLPHCVVAGMGQLFGNWQGCHIPMSHNRS